MGGYTKAYWLHFWILSDVCAFLIFIASEEAAAVDQALKVHLLRKHVSLVYFAVWIIIELFPDKTRRWQSFNSAQAILLDHNFQKIISNLFKVVDHNVQ